MEKKVLMAALVIIGIVVLIAGCYSILNSKNGSNEYVFVEHYVETQGFLADEPEVNAYVYMGYPTSNSTTSHSSVLGSASVTIGFIFTLPSPTAL